MQNVRSVNREPDVINTRRNPYLIDYEKERAKKMQNGIQMHQTGTKSRQSVRRATVCDKKAYAAAKARRRRTVRRQRLAIALWIVCIVVIGTIVFLNSGIASIAGEKNGSGRTVRIEEELISLSSGSAVQGLPADKFAEHPVWTENFLTPNEYSRPGEPLEKVSSIFVHYTANPGTSAAQNRSYFEQQKDTHEASVSAHFIIGYEGEIVQCLPLDEIGYAVQTRNYDSISIECCYKAADGSFTRETYESLIALLRWLVDVYDLDTEDILRHYDCGGKKCPLYYTENEEEWEKLKQDVATAGQI